ncbi:DUF2281 domain-containing protein [Microcoleus sp. T3_D1]|jgi:ABC-type molybdate transport system permease subunit|uniref:DUF2281 domain-containing protein n=1 Tax=Microcoleus sp. T3_D1 TaxID=3055427 RepID=UPI002FD4CDC8
MLETTILESLVKLPDSLKQEVLHYIEFLVLVSRNEVLDAYVVRGFSTQIVFLWCCRVIPK